MVQGTDKGIDGWANAGKDRSLKRNNSELSDTSTTAAEGKKKAKAKAKIAPKKKARVDENKINIGDVDKAAKPVIVALDRLTAQDTVCRDYEKRLETSKEDFGWAKDMIKEMQESLLVDPSVYHLITKLHTLCASSSSIGKELVQEFGGAVAKEKMTHLQVELDVVLDRTNPIASKLARMIAAEGKAVSMDTGAKKRKK
jgi:hypothetical protein